MNTWLADRDPAYEISPPAPNVVRIANRNRVHDQLDIQIDPLSWLRIGETSISLADPNRPEPAKPASTSGGPSKM
ncbi:MAG: hypothetical protein ACLP59_23505 [Bryobacteraceae bacterium]